MQKVFEENAPKKAIDLFVNCDLLSKARKLNINLSAALESALVLQVRKATREEWLSENKDAISSLNELAESNGLFSDSYNGKRSRQ